MEIKERLDKAIIGTFAELSNLSMKNDSLKIQEWIVQSMIQLYSNNDSKGFLCEYQNNLNISKSDIIDLLVDNYSQSINDSNEQIIQDLLKKTIKNIINKEGLTKARIQLKKYIELDDINSLIKIDDSNSKLTQYSVQGLTNVMCREYVENILQNKEKQLQNKKESSTITKNEFYPYEFFMIGNNEAEFDIDKVVSAMESIRSGEIKTVGEAR